MSNSVCTLSKLSEELSTLFGSLPFGGENAGEIVAEVTTLADRAFVAREAEAAAFAERLLYGIHARHAFAPPVQAVAGTVWSVLMRAKLNACMTDRVGTAGLTHDEMAEALNVAVRRADERDHPLLDVLAADDDLRGLAVYTKNWYGSTHGFTTQLIALLQRCNGKPAIYAVFLNLLENLNGEFADGSHPERRGRWPARLGIEYSPERSLEDADHLTEAFALQTFRTGISLVNDPMFALGSFYSIESVFPGVCNRLYPALQRRGFDEESIATFRIHRDVDEDHSAQFMGALARCTLTPAERVRIANGGLAQLELRHQMFAGLRRYLKK